MSRCDGAFTDHGAFTDPLLVVQLSVDHSELEDARWFSLEEVTSALQVNSPPRSGDAPVIWFPPKQAIGNRLIREWADRQRRGEERE